MAIQFFQSASASTPSILVIPFSKGEIPGKMKIPAKLLKLAAKNDVQFMKGDRKVLLVNTGRQKMALVNVGPLKNLDAEKARALAAPLYAVLKAEDARHVVLDMTGLKNNAEAVAHLKDALRVQGYSYRAYKSAPEEEARIGKITCFTADSASSAVYKKLAIVTNAAFWASDAVNAPPNMQTPQSYAHEIASMAQKVGAKAKVLSVPDLEKLGMNAHLAVGQGSQNGARLVVLQHDGSEGQQKQPLALVGKGITFDSGGLTLKLSHMEEMKMDMGGAAAVAGAFFAAVQRGTTANIVAVLPLAENMPSGNAIMPSAVVTSASGKTIEIVDTDCEGRLVLADAMTYAQRHLHANKVVTAATLTGACGTAIGAKMAGLFTENKRLLKIFQESAQKTGERVWHLPMGKEFEELMTSGTVADIKNYSSKPGGASTAAAFLNFFIDKDSKQRPKAAFAHVDMAYPAMPEQDLKGWGVRLLDEVIRRHEPRNGR